jgi:hypothetical protein
MLNKISNNFLLPSAAFTLNRGKIKFWKPFGKRRPKIGDLVFGVVTNLGQHKTLENKSGRIHAIYKGTNIIAIFGNRYAPNYYEGVIPKNITGEVDLLARSGVIGLVLTKNDQVIDPTKVKIYGYVCDKKGKILNTRDCPLISPNKAIKNSPRSKMILVCGTSMNSGKSSVVFTCCQTLSFYGHRVKMAKVTGTASLKDILGASDAGAKPVADFSYLGYPSTYLLKKQDVLDIFNKLDLKYANNPKNYWVVEFADGINQRETRMLLMAEDVRKRIHKFIFCASDAFGAIGGIKKLRENFNLEPDLISGICSSSPLHIREIKEFINKPVLNSHNPNMEELIKLL